MDFGRFRSMRRLSALVGLCALVLPLTAEAARQEADSCANGLTSDSRMIYGAAVDKVGPGVDNRQVVRDLTQQFVQDGKLARSSARPAAEAAGKCLALLMK